MVLIHTVGDTGDYISVTLIGGNHVQFEYESGKGPQGVTVETAYRYIYPSSGKFTNDLKFFLIHINACLYNIILISCRLDDDKWHSILVERNRKEAMVVVDGARKGQVKEPRGPVRPMLLNKPLYIGM